MDLHVLWIYNYIFLWSSWPPRRLLTTFVMCAFKRNMISCQCQFVVYYMYTLLVHETVDTWVRTPPPPPPPPPPFLIPPMMWSVNWPWYVYVYIFINRVSSFFGLRSLRMIVKLLWNSLLDALYWANQIDGPIPNLENKQKSALNRTFLGCLFPVLWKRSEKLRFVSTEYFFFIYTVFQMVLSCWSKGIHYYLLG